MKQDTLDAAVLDTNVVLDWLLFRDPRAAALGAAIEGGWLRWVACGRMRDEFAHTLRAAVLNRWRPDAERLLGLFDGMACMVPQPAPSPMCLRCDDHNDQIFVDLALASGARWLLTHDKALLRLRRRVPPRGPLICRPFDWSMP